MNAPNPDLGTGEDTAAAWIAKFLQTRGIRQHHAEEVPGPARAEHRAAVALAHQARQVAGVVDVGMAQEHGRQRGRIHARRGPVPQAQLLEPLKESAVQKQPPPPVVEQVLGAGDGAGRAEEGERGRHSDTTSPRSAGR